MVRSSSLPTPPSLYSGERWELPAWALRWTEDRVGCVRFTWKGSTWRIVLDGAHNNTFKDGEYRTTLCPYVRAVPDDEEALRLPEPSTPLGDFAVALRALQEQGRRFTPDDLAECVAIGDDG